EVATIGFNCKFEKELTQYINELLPKRGRGIKDVDARVVIPDAQFAWRTEHSLREITHRFLLTNGEIADLCSNAGQRHFVALLDIGRATDDAKFLCACIHACVAEMVRSGYFFQVSNLGGDDVIAPIGSYI